MYVVHMQNADGTPLEPTTRFGKVRRMLDAGEARVVFRKPFTIRLTKQIENPVVRRYVGGTDPGRTNVGGAVVRKDGGEVVYVDELETDNKNVPGRMRERKTARQASRRGERLARKRLAGKHGTLSTKLENGRRIPDCEKLTDVRDIINTEARFANRVRKPDMTDVVSTAAKWVTPTVKHLVETHLNHVDQIRRLYPISEWCLELNRFAFMRMEDDTVRGSDFQNGRMKGYASVEEYVFALQGGRCACCGEPLEDCHHVVPRHEGGSDGPDNRIGLCKKCHHAVHTGRVDIDAVGTKQKYAALSVLNQAVPFIYDGLVERFGEGAVHVCFGYQTKEAREAAGLPKDHRFDAAAIVAASTGISISYGEDTAESYEVKQFRRHDRARISTQRERTYYVRTGTRLNGKPILSAVAKNRRPREEQEGDALSDWYEKQVLAHGKENADVERSRLVVKKSVRSYNLPPKERIMPGATYEHGGKRYVLKSREGNGFYFNPIDKSGRVTASECRLLTRNGGLVYL